MPSVSELATNRYTPIEQEVGTASLARIAAVVGPTVEVSKGGKSIDWIGKGISLVVGTMPDDRRPGVEVRGSPFRWSYEEADGDSRVLGREHDLILAGEDGVAVLNAGNEHVKDNINYHRIDPEGNFTEGSLPQTFVSAKFKEARTEVAHIRIIKT
jgi:hypothetical protein